MGVCVNPRPKFLHRPPAPAGPPMVRPSFPRPRKPDSTNIKKVEIEDEWDLDWELTEEIFNAAKKQNIEIPEELKPKRIISDGETVRK